jgi:serine protease AprX
MKRVLSIFFLGVWVVIASSSQVSASMDAPLGNVDIIIQTDGSTQPLIEQISELGGSITSAYQNLPVIAVNLPANALKSIHDNPNVIRVAKDHPLSLLDVPERDGSPGTPDFYSLDASGFEVKSLDLGSLKPGISTLGYSGYLDTGADQIWEASQLGSGSVVAVVDTGTVPNVCLQEAVIGAPGFPDGFNATGDGIAATDPSNQWHGTHIGGIIASACALDFSTAPNDPLNQAVKTHTSWDKNWVPIFGQAPGSKIYPVKIFDKDGGDTSIEVVLRALDHLLTLKRSGVLDIDVVNLSFGGPTGFEGRAILDTFLEQLRDEDILVVAAAGNNGPLPNSLASPASSKASIAVGALDYPATSRVSYEYLGLTELGTPGQGMVMRPTDEIRVADLSSRGPFSDGRFGPDLVAPGMWSFQFFSQAEFHWVSGTSFASAAVSGAAALLNARYETNTSLDTPWMLLRNSLLLGADRQIIGTAWQDPNDSGYGALDAVAALQVLDSGKANLPAIGSSYKLRSNILANPNSSDHQVFESGDITLDPSHSYDALLDISSSTSKVSIHVYDIHTPDNSGYAYWPNSLRMMVQSAKRSAAPVPINRYWDPNSDRDNFTITIDDGTWNFAGDIVASQPMEPGLMKVSLIADYANQSPVSFKLRISRQQDLSSLDDKSIAHHAIKMGDVFTFPVEIPAGTSKAIFNLVWNRDWLKYPTSDMDLRIFGPDQESASQDGMTWNAPERVVITDPKPGKWIVQVEAREIYKTDLFRLFLDMESTQGETSQFDIISQHPDTNSPMGTGDDSTSPNTIWLPVLR